MARPSKPAVVIDMEGRSHRTKQEMAIRRRGEASLLTGIKIKESPEVKNDCLAHEKFRQVKKQLEAIEKDDDLYGTVINRYCLLYSECFELKKQADSCKDRLEELDLSDDKSKEMTQLRTSLLNSYLNANKLLDSKRNMMFTIEKENVMTVASALRSIPKSADKKTNPLMEALKKQA